MVNSGNGSQETDMVRIPNECSCMTTYSKRRSGVFKKASELVTLCGAEVAIIVFFSKGQTYSFGHPNVERVVDRYLTGEVPCRTATAQLVEVHRNAWSRELNTQLTEALYRVEREKRHGEELDRIRSESQSQRWWESPIEGMNLAQLDQLQAALRELRQKVQDRAEKIALTAAQAQQTFPANAFAPDRNGPAPNADFPAASNPFQPGGLYVFPPAPNSNAAGAFESGPDLTLGILPSNQPAARMSYTDVVPFGYNFGNGKNGFF